jgi:hypothetical protein
MTKETPFRMAEAADGQPLVECDITIALAPETFVNRFKGVMDAIVDIDDVEWVKIADAPVGLVRQMTRSFLGTQGP